MSDTLQHTATHCNTLQHTATHCNTLQHTGTHYNTLQHTATHCNKHNALSRHERINECRFSRQQRCNTWREMSVKPIISENRIVTASYSCPRTRRPSRKSSTAFGGSMENRSSSLRACSWASSADRRSRRNKSLFCAVLLCFDS